jgi:brefeldin A-inhibited guanine nucleotide-exchange protein
VQTFCETAFIFCFENSTFYSPSLRHLLTQGGFYLPGEAQQIDRIVSTFARCYWEDNAGDPTHCPFKNQDTIFLLSFAIIMLNTDLHKSNSVLNSSKKNQKRSMSKLDFIKNLQGVGNGSEIDQEYLSDVYDKIQSQPIAIQEDITESEESSVTSENIQTNIAKLVENAKNVDALLRGLSTHEYSFVSFEEYSSELEASPGIHTKDLVKKLVAQVWHQFHGLINSALEVAHLDPRGMETNIHLLKYSLCLTILLEMPMEQIAFLDQLGRFYMFNLWCQGNGGDLPLDDQESYKSEDWYSRIEYHARFPSKEGKQEALLILDETIGRLDFTSSSKVEGRRALRDAVRQIENAEFLLNDPSRSFVRQGNLLKRANRSGRCIEYQFYLFSDVLIYAKKMSGSDKYRIHEELPLILMKVVDWFPPELKKESKLGIHIYHPRKKFLVLCASAQERKSWVTALRASIDKELERRVAVEGARKAATNIPSGTN